MKATVLRLGRSVCIKVLSLKISIMESLIVATDIVDLGSVCAMIVGLIYSTILDFCDVCLLKKKNKKQTNMLPETGTHHVNSCRNVKEGALNCRAKFRHGIILRVDSPAYVSE